MPPRNFAANRKTQPRSLFIAAPRSAETVENMRQFFRRNADPLIRNDDGLSFKRQTDAFAFRRKFDRVIQHNQQHLPQARIIAHDLQRVSRLTAVKAHAFATAKRARAHRHIAQQFAHVHAPHIQREIRVLQP